ncbi:DUF389 domain-containing protein [Psychrobacter sp. HD31]|uniref:DUF389 domain-containing protein n=1 Tax=Psychrobacter sp. HD31 TaxID=3112003 RepID=UPI003DA62CF0
MSDENKSNSRVIVELFDLRKDQANADDIDETLRTNVKVAGTNLWVLFFAILVASVGLNVNSTAVVIGAMLISPLMGPIVGIGYGMGVNDASLIKLALQNLGIFTLISLIASTLYFTISPLDVAQSELLSRTSPTLWDVLIAFFGGSAGIIATTRKSMSNVVPGVAIATALMPPLCTAGFGLAQGNWSYFAGAFFLYSINSVFIALATFLFVNIFHLPKRHYVDKKTEKRNHMYIVITVLLMIIPSIYFAYNLVKQSQFTQFTNQYINASINNNGLILLGKDVNPQQQSVILTLGGADEPNKIQNEFEHQLIQRGFKKANVTIRNSGTSALDLSNLKTELTQDLYNSMVNQVEMLSKENQRLETELASSSKLISEDESLYAELAAQYTKIHSTTISRGELFAKDKQPIPLIKVEIGSKQALSDTDKKRIENWLTAKYQQQALKVEYQVTSTVPTVIQPVKVKANSQKTQTIEKQQPAIQ